MDAVRAIINRERGARGFAPLAANAHIELAAQRHSDDMLAHAKLDHDGSDGSKPWDRMTREGYAWSKCGEIIALYQTSSEEDVVRLWINSPPHYAIMFSGDYTEFGAGVSGPYWTVDFGRPLA